jgi:hypothetical protein
MYVMNLKRHGEESHTPFRNRRLYSENGQWYFDTREGKQFGPYKDKNEAGKALAIFIAQSVYNQNTDRTDKNDPHHGAQDGIESLVEELLDFFLYLDAHGQTDALLWANHRLQELTENNKSISNCKQRIEALKYAMDQE